MEMPMNYVAIIWTKLIKLIIKLGEVACELTFLVQNYAFWTKFFYMLNSQFFVPITFAYKEGIRYKTINIL
jgi:hypothetical protein